MSDGGGFRRWSPWAKPAAAAPTPPAHAPSALPPSPPAAPVAAVKKKGRRPVVAPAPVEKGGALQIQVAAALRAVIDSGEFTVHGLARQTGLTDNTVTRALSGQGMKLVTLEAVAAGLGWTVTVTDATGTAVASNPSSPPDSAPDARHP